MSIGAILNIAQSGTFRQSGGHPGRIEQRGQRGYPGLFGAGGRVGGGDAHPFADRASGERRDGPAGKKLPRPEPPERHHEAKQQRSGTAGLRAIPHADTERLQREQLAALHEHDDLFQRLERLVDGPHEHRGQADRSLRRRNPVHHLQHHVQRSRQSPVGPERLGQHADRRHQWRHCHKSPPSTN